MISIELAVQLAGILVTGVVVVVGMKVSLNGMRENVRETRADVKTLLASDKKQDIQIVGIQAEQEANKGWLRRLETWLERHQNIIDRRELDAR